MILEGIFQIYPTHGGSYSWWLLDEDGSMIAHAPTHYDSVADCIAVIEQVKRLAGRASIKELAVPQQPNTPGAGQDRLKS